MLEDRQGRKIQYLRVSATDRCNLHCVYCRPFSGFRAKKRSDLLTFEEIHRVATAASRLGVKSFRVTGGEPLVRKNISFLVELLRSCGDVEVAMTTNGVLLSRKARELTSAGLDRVNISIDSLVPEKYAHVTGGGKLNRVLWGIDSALALGLAPVKLNVVVMRGFNEDELETFAALSADRPLHVRFIRLMSGCSAQEKYAVSGREIKKRIEDVFGPLEPADGVPGFGPAENGRIKGAKGTLGFIDPFGGGFCTRCTRLRLTADGLLRPCLQDHASVSVREAARCGDDRLLEEALRGAALLKPDKENCAGRYVTGMCRIGG